MESHGKGSHCEPGTISRASIASSYSMKPNPFMSLISVILPVPCVLKWSSISCLVAKIRRRERVSLDQSSGATGDTAGPPSRDRKSRRIRQRLGITTTIDGKGSWKTSEPAYHYEEDCLGRGGYLTLHSLCWRSSAQELTEWIT
jgi:hypothetical protein